MDAELVFISNVLLWILCNQSYGSETTTFVYDDPISLCSLLDIPNGRMFYQSTPGKAIVRCDPGYDLVGRKKMFCIDGKWLGGTPKCVSSVECSGYFLKRKWQMLNKKNTTTTFRPNYLGRNRRPCLSTGNVPESTPSYVARSSLEVEIYIAYSNDSVETTTDDERLLENTTNVDDDLLSYVDDVDSVRPSPTRRSFAVVGVIVCALMVASTLLVFVVLKRYECLARIRVRRSNGSVSDVRYLVNEEDVNFIPTIETKRTDCLS